MPQTKPLARSDQRTLSFSGKRKLAVPGTNRFKKKLFAEGILKESASLISDAQRSDTVSHDESVWRKWDSWCKGRQINPITCPLNFILDFLAQCYEGLPFNTIAKFRSVISVYYDGTGRVSVGSNASL